MFSWIHSSESLIENILWGFLLHSIVVMPIIYGFDGIFNDFYFHSLRAGRETRVKKDIQKFFQVITFGPQNATHLPVEALNPLKRPFMTWEKIINWNVHPHKQTTTCYGQIIIMQDRARHAKQRNMLAALFSLPTSGVNVTQQWISPSNGYLVKSKKFYSYFWDYYVAANNL